MSGQNGQNNNQRQKTIFDDWRQPLACSLVPHDGAKYNSQCVWQQKSNGKIVLKINDGIYDPSAKTNPREVELNWASRNNFFEAILEAANNPNFTMGQYQVRKKDFIKSGGQNKISDNPIMKAQITIERDANGVISFTYRKGEYSSTITFRGPNDDLMIMKNPATGEKYEDRGLMSQFAARSWVRFHREPLNKMERERWEPAAPKDGGNGGGGFNRNNNGGGNSRPQQNNSNDDGFDSFEDPDF